MVKEIKAVTIATSTRQTQKGECASVFAWGNCKFAGDIITYGSFVIQHMCNAPDNFYHQCPYSGSNNIMIGIYDPTMVD